MPTKLEAPRASVRAARQGVVPDAKADDDAP
jgi:hypothetical protein